MLFFSRMSFDPFKALFCKNFAAASLVMVSFLEDGPDQIKFHGPCDVHLL